MTITLQDPGEASSGNTCGDARVRYTMRARERIRLCLAGTSRVYSSAVEHRIADPAVAGSIPAAPCIAFWLFFFSVRLESVCVSQHTFSKSLWPNWTRRLTTNQKIGGSSPSRDNFCILHKQKGISHHSFGRSKKIHPRWDSNPQSSAPETDALSIRPLGLGLALGAGCSATHMIIDNTAEQVRLTGQLKHAGIAQLGERQTEDLKVAGSIPAVGNLFIFCFSLCVVVLAKLLCCPGLGHHGTLAEWLRRSIRNRLGIARGSSNLSGVELIFFSRSLAAA